MIVRKHRNGNLSLSVSFGSGNFTKLNNLPGFSKWDKRLRVFSPVNVNIKYIVENWPDADWQDGTISYKQHYLEVERKADHTRAAKKRPVSTDDPSGYDYRRLPMEHQRKAFMLSRDEVAFGLFMEQGTGKTKVIIDTAAYLYKKGLIDMLVVIAWPNGVHRVWVDYEIPLDMPEWCPYHSEFWASSLSKGKQKAIASMFNAANKLKIFSFNVEAFTSRAAKEHLLKCVNDYRCLLVIDQSASIKNPKAKRTEFLVEKVSKKATYRRILDGQPVAEGADELFSQFNFLDPSIIGHGTWTAFRAEFCKLGYFNNTVGYINLPELHRRIDGYSFRVLADECLDLPDRVYKRWRFDLLPDERRVFNDLNKESLAFFNPSDEDEGVITEKLAMIKNMRLQQITSGWFPQEDNFKRIVETPSRLSALLSLLKQIEGKALIFSRFRADLELLQAWLGDKAVSYFGGVTEEKRAESKHDFMTDDRVKYFIGQPRTAGIGHTLTAAKHVIFYSNEPSLRFREECEKRAHRKGIEKTLKRGEKLIIWDLIASRTNDEKNADALIEKKDISVEILNDPQSWFMIEGENE